MSQADIGNITSGQTGPDFFDNKLEPWRNALHSSHSGSSRPPYAIIGLRWDDSTTNPIICKYYTGSTDISFAVFDTSANTHGTIAATVGPNTTQRHTVPAVASDTFTLNNNPNIFGANQQVSLTNDTVWNGDSNTSIGSQITVSNLSNTVGACSSIRFRTRSSSVASSAIFSVNNGSNNASLHYLTETGDHIFYGGTNATQYAKINSLGVESTLFNIKSTGTGAFNVILKNTENITANRDLTISTNDANRTISLSGDLTLNKSIVLDSGTYTPTLFNTTNVAASTAYVCQWVRVGDIVTVSGLIDIDPTTAGAATTLGLSLPIASNFAAISQLGGTAVASGVQGQGYACIADTTNDRASFTGVPASNANATHAFNFSYRII